MAIYFKDTEITNIDNLVPQTGLDITDMWFGTKNIYTVWAVYEGILPATINVNGDDMRQYQIYGNTGGVGDRTVQLFDKDANDTDNGYVNSAGLFENGRVQPDAGWVAFFVSEYIAILPNKSYILKNAFGNNCAFCIYDSNKTYIWGQKYANISTINFNSGDGAYFIRLTINKTQNKDTFMLTEGTTPPENYVPFGYEVDMVIRDTTTINIGNEPLCGIGTYTDSLNLSTGMLTRRIKKLVLTGNENWRGADNNTSKNLFGISNYKVESGVTCVSTHYRGANNVVSGDTIPNNSACFFIEGDLRTLYLKGSEPITLADFKSYLAAQYAAGTPVTVWYVLAEPKVSTITIPAGLTGTIEGYLIQDGTPTPETPIYPTANGVKQADGTYSIKYSTSSTTTPIYIGNEPLEKDEYVDYQEEKVYRKKAVHEDTVTINGIVWDILGYDCDIAYKDDNTLAQHTVTIQTHNCINELQFDEREALFAFPEGLAAGAYHFTITAQPWYADDIGKTITFTITSAIPAGGQLVVNNSYNATMIGSTISSYASSSATTAIETATMSEGSDGTDLGSVDVSLSQDGNTNSIQRVLVGSNNWSQSAIRQYLNSSAAAGSVWTPQTKFDRPPSWAVNTAGFLQNADREFISVLGDTTKITALNTVTDGGGLETKFEKVFLLSRSEVYGGDEVSGGEGAPYPYYANYSSLSGGGSKNDSNRIKYRNRAAKPWWLRSPYVGHANRVRIVNTSGAIDYYSAATTTGIAPACVIILDDIATNSWLREKFLKPTDPPVALPALPTCNGKTIVDYAGSGTVPEKAFLKYRKENF